MRRAKLIKRKEIIEEEKKAENRKLASAKAAARLAPATVRTWVKQHQTERTSAYQAFAALFGEPHTKGIA